MMEHTVYHQCLRIGVAVLACVLIFDSGYFIPGSEKLSNTTEQYLASVIGVSASVEPTRYNEITAALAERSSELDEREASIAAREITLSKNPAGVVSSGVDTSTFIISVILFIMLVLIVLNYGLDYARTRQHVISYAKTS